MKILPENVNIHITMLWIELKMAFIIIPSFHLLMFRFGTCMTFAQVRTRRGMNFNSEMGYLIEDNYAAIPQVCVSSLQWDITKTEQIVS